MRRKTDGDDMVCIKVLDELESTVRPIFVQNKEAIFSLLSSSTMAIKVL
jgi:hypothetical protein